MTRRERLEKLPTNLPSTQLGAVTFQKDLTEEATPGSELR